MVYVAGRDLKLGKRHGSDKDIIGLFFNRKHFSAIKHDNFVDVARRILESSTNPASDEMWPTSLVRVDYKGYAERLREAQGAVHARPKRSNEDDQEVEVVEEDLMSVAGPVSVPHKRLRIALGKKTIGNRVELLPSSEIEASFTKTDIVVEG